MKKNLTIDQKRKNIHINRKMFFVVYEKVRKGGISIEGLENIDHKRGSMMKMD
jgi:hypothetical protein